MTGFLLALAQLTLRDPAAAARAVMGLRLSAGMALAALVLTSVLGAILAVVTYRLSGEADPALEAWFGQPLDLAMSQVAAQVVAAALAWKVGSWFGGRGGLADALALVAWIEALLLVLQLAQLVLIGPLPGLSAALGFLGVAMAAWLATVFVAELHGFRSRGLVFFGILATLFGVAVLLILIGALVLGAGGQ